MLIIKTQVTKDLLIVYGNSIAIEQAEQWSKDDPYVDAGVYKKVTVKPFKECFKLFQLLPTSNAILNQDS